MPRGSHREGFCCRQLRTGLALLFTLIVAAGVSHPVCAQTFSILHSFSGPDAGSHPAAAPIQGPNGSWYGTTSQGGAYGVGTVYLAPSDGSALQTLHTFTGSDGADPEAALIQGQDGRLYGSTRSGGTGALGAVFRLNADGTGFQILHAFGGPDGSTPTGALVQAPDGSLYGTTAAGGAGGFGIVFRISPDGTGFQDLADLDSTNGAAPQGLALGSDGTLYGAAAQGGANSSGAVFRVQTDGTGLQALYSFSGSDGATPGAAVIQGADGALYGTTVSGGAKHLGVVFGVHTDGTGYRTLYSFNGSDGVSPSSRLIQASDGTLYGTTRAGGSHPGPRGLGLGTVFLVRTDHPGFQTLYNLGGPDGANPTGLAQGADGRLHGASTNGGLTGLGDLFALNTDGSGFQIGPSFSGAGSEGYSPTAATVTTVDGALYGACPSGGAYGAGCVFRLNDDGSGYTVLYSFRGTDGASPAAPLTLGHDGRLYGATVSGGANGLGTMFRLRPDGTAFQTVHSFNGTDGAAPQSALVQAGTGLFYGATPSGGANGLGSVFRLRSDGTAFQTLHSFRGADGARPQGGVLVGKDGALYGATAGTTTGTTSYGTVYTLQTDGTGFQTLHTFNGTDGAAPIAALVQDPGGTLYGTTSAGGANGLGVIFSLQPNGSGYQLRYSFNGTSGSHPTAPLVRDRLGSLYGTTPSDSANSAPGSGGTAFEWNAVSGLTVLHRFSSGPTDGAEPVGGLQLGADGSVTGTTLAGGTYDFGSVFRLSPNPRSIASLVVSPSALLGGGSAVGTVTLSGPAPVDTVVTLGSASGSIAVPGTVTLPAGQTSATFPIATTAVGAVTNVAVQATLNFRTWSRTLTLLPIGIRSLNIRPGILFGSEIATGAILLDAPAPAPVVITLASSAPTIAKLSATAVTIPLGATSAAFTLEAAPVVSRTPVTVTASTGADTRAVQVTVRPIGVRTVTLSPQTVQGGAATTGTITLEAPSAPGRTVAVLSSSAPHIAAVPATVTLVRGAVAGSVLVRTRAVAAKTVVTLTATANGVTRSTRLTLTP